jgi:DNA-binding CsgD family transcriptional regulator
MAIWRKEQEVMSTASRHANNPTDIHLSAARVPAARKGADVDLSGAVVTPAALGSQLGGRLAEPRLRGRRGECEALDRLMAGVWAGQSRVLVLRGEAGAGKTTLLEYLVERASGCRIARVSGAESEIELAFAGLHQLCAPFLDGLDQLPGPQRDALSTAFGLRDGDVPDRFAVGLAVLGLLSEAAAEQPLVAVVDDAQWLDRASAQALAFVARHLVAGPVAVVFAMRRCGQQHERDLAGLPELVVGGLTGPDARALLDSFVAGPLDEGVRDRIVAETRGNPLALLEVARGLTPGELAGGFGLPEALPSDLAGPDRAEESVRRRLATLPEATRLLLLVAAAEPVADPILVWGAASRLGIEAAAAAPAAAAGLIESGGQVRFRHPLARAAVYRAASPQDRQTVHGALAEATDPDADPDRRAWHRAHAVPGLDEDVAAELERATSRARTRGGLAAAAAFGERAAELTPSPDRRAQRALTAAVTSHQAGEPDAALRLLAMAQAGPLDELGHVRAELLGAQIAANGDRRRDAPLRLLEAARRLEPLHPGLARQAYGDAFYAALTAGGQTASDTMTEVAQAAYEAPQAREPSRACDLLLDGLAAMTLKGYAAGAPVLSQALTAFRGHQSCAERECGDASCAGQECGHASCAGQELGWLPLACRISRDVWDDQSWHALSTRLIELARQAGALGVLPAALLSGAAVQLAAGQLTAAASMAREAEAVAQATGNQVEPYGPMALAAWTGRETDLGRLIGAGPGQPAAARRQGQWPTAAHWATAVLNNGLCRYEQALAAAERGCEYPDELGLALWSAVELIEAAVRTGAPERAADAMQWLAETTAASGTDWALGMQARSQALLTEGESAERLYREAIERLGRTCVRTELARAHLLYGEWLRRQSRRVDAREQLSYAHQMLTEMGIEGFAERARRELLATGQTVRKRTDAATGLLTAQEAQIARLAGSGHTNPEIGVQLFISARTVEWHLRKIFTKLGVSSRKELRRALPDLGRLAQSA